MDTFEDSIWIPIYVHLWVVVQSNALSLAIAQPGILTLAPLNHSVTAILKPSSLELGIQRVYPSLALCGLKLPFEDANHLHFVIHLPRIIFSHISHAIPIHPGIVEPLHNAVDA